MLVVSVGAGEVWSGEGTLVVARAGEERRVDLHGGTQSNAGDHKGPLPTPPLRFLRGLLASPAPVRFG
jgi:hypothetical protein